MWVTNHPALFIKKWRSSAKREIHFFFLNIECVFEVYGKEFTLSLSSFLWIILISWRVDLSYAPFSCFFKGRWVNFIEQQSLGVYIVKFNINNKTVSYFIFMRNSIKDFIKFNQTWGMFLTLWQMASLYWLFSSVFDNFVEILFVWFLPSMCKSNNTFSFLLSSVRISVSKANLVFTQRKPPISVLS